ncbi:MAG: 3'-5' exonuclease [Lachnospiraceae bacterium]|jgi:DNA polymerase-3 subunit epsilon|nr:3'-5' exonuclease [Lachnospiraceae bacterium]
MLKSYVAFDVETTGLDPVENEVIEIGALKVRQGKVVDRFMEFIKPSCPIPPKITGLTGICDAMVASARTRDQVIPDFLEFCRDDVLIGHNILFDYGFIKMGAEALGYAFVRDGIDTLKIARAVHRDLPSRSLGELCDHYQIENAAAHRAYHDALATAKLYQTMAHYYEETEPLVFRPAPLVYVGKPSPKATKKQLDLLMRLTKQRKLAQDWDPETLTVAEASKRIERILSR